MDVTHRHELPQGKVFGPRGGWRAEPYLGPVALLVMIVQDGTIQTLSTRHVALIDALLVFKKL